MFKKRLLFLIYVICICNITTKAATIYVATNGNDNNIGTKENPLATIQAALLKARNLRRLNNASITDGIHIVLQKGIYNITETIVLHPEDSGTPTSPTYIEAAENENVIISGGVQIKNWKKNIPPINGFQKNIQNKICVANVPLVNGNLFNFRQLYVNDKKAIRAKSANADTMHRIINWNKKEQTCVIPTLPFAQLYKLVNAEMFIHQWWEIANLRIKKMDITKDSTTLYFYQPESKIQSEHPWPAPWLSKETGNSAFYLTNAMQFVDEPGEWYLDFTKQKIYYYPLPNENMQTANVTAPFAETIFAFNGTAQNPIENIVIKNIELAHTGWLRPSLQGHVPHQAGMYMTEAYKLKPSGTKENPKLDNQAWIGRQAAAIELNYVSNVNIVGCKFQKLAATAIDFKIGAKNVGVVKNLFNDIGGSAIVAGNYGDEGREIHLPYIPKTESEICNNILLENNFITNVANEDWGCVGIACGYVANTTIQHNEIENVSYSGISVGWGWTPTVSIMQSNKIIANKIHHFGKHNYDCGGIYTLSSQANSILTENYIDCIYKAPYAHLPSHWFYLYADEGTSGYTVTNNYTPSQKFLQNQNGTNNTWANNGPMVDESVKQNAGLQKEFQYLKKYSTIKNVQQEINVQRKEVIEIIANNMDSFDVQKLKQILVNNKIDTSAIYKWNNHFVIYDYVQDVTVMQGRLKNKLSNVKVKTYPNMFYEYAKNKHCNDKSIAKEWEHILLTANLVKDDKKEYEYLTYHKNQFKDWPQVSQGFCNADFQELVIFKNGKQLILVISIPKGKTLDELNPKTTDNNPKMNEWNKIMGQYQEGIEGTKKGESWVFLKKVE
jgi:hypothetical protein